MILLFDTETTGKWNFKQDYTWADQPHLVELGAILCDKEGREKSVLDLIADPEDNFVIGDEVAKIHGINHITAQHCGVPTKVILSAFNFLCHKATLIVCHNANFDMQIMRAQYHKHKVPHRMTDVPVLCTMEELTPVMKLPKKWPKPDDPYKWPSLMESYKKYVNPEGFGNAHNALADVRATKEVLFAAIEAGDIAWPT